jgi:hypothetical protein
MIGVGGWEHRPCALACLACSGPAPCRTLLTVAVLTPSPSACIMAGVGPLSTSGA